MSGITLKSRLLKIRLVRSILRARATRERERFSSTEYWESRYHAGGSSGVGSYGAEADAKAAYLNEFVTDHGVGSVIEFGCGDGNQLRYAEYPSYLGFDVSESAVARCTELFAGDDTKEFRLLDGYDGQIADLAMSLDVIYHLIEDQIFEDHMARLFSAARRFVVIYSSDENRPGVATHVVHREFTRWVEQNAPTFGLIDEPSGSPRSESGEPVATFYAYQAIPPQPSR
jgi:SAM-dependent methyltransferase